MRRSLREAIVGFSLLAAIAGGVGLWAWLKGISLNQNIWTIKVRFADAAGLADRSSVTYRGVLGGSVRKIQVSSGAVEALLEISDPNLRLRRPVMAEVTTGSLLGGDAEVALISTAPPSGEPTARPGSRDCDPKVMVCSGGEVPGTVAASLSSVTSLMQNLLNQANEQRIVPRIADLTTSIDGTSKQANRFLGDSRVLVRDLNAAVRQADPILANLKTATAEAAQATRHIRNVAAAFDNPRTVAQLKTTAANAEKLTARWEAVGGDVNKLTADPQFMDGVRSVTLGLGKFFDELYPAQAGDAKTGAKSGSKTPAGAPIGRPAVPMR
ncbi:MlaD family protein [Cyanobium sp. Morenito 9A2]|uniref:MlaD family protein n=1 Tax=Cyanobium sp. Morenito 9A2 TaxID=2823718 RepID=UPI0020CEE14A|nr:MlaD family protein [Cyanobium sp. Morenito 9A2]MCP9849592.1 MCE family protein [Cyanobium sp. Morenito 9A2]